MNEYRLGAWSADAEDVARTIDEATAAWENRFTANFSRRSLHDFGKVLAACTSLSLIKKTRSMGAITSKKRQSLDETLKRL
jgi:hypothetical protein